jgi:hypothetical protein
MEKRKYICKNVPYFQYRTNDTIYEVTLAYTTDEGEDAKYIYDAYVEDGILYVEQIKIDVFNKFLNEHSEFSICKKDVCFCTNSFRVKVFD